MHNEPTVGLCQNRCAWRRTESWALGLCPYPLSALQQETYSWNKCSLLWGGFLLGLSSDAHTPGVAIWKKKTGMLCGTLPNVNQCNGNILVKISNHPTFYKCGIRVNLFDAQGPGCRHTSDNTEQGPGLGRSSHTASLCDAIACCFVCRTGRTLCSSKDQK